VALAELGRKDDAVAAARQAVTLDPESADLWEMLAGRPTRRDTPARRRRPRRARRRCARAGRPPPVTG
jgi:hypothetical protein